MAEQNSGVIGHHEVSRTPFDSLSKESKETADQLSLEMENIRQGLAITLLGLSPTQKEKFFEYLRDFGNGTWAVREGRDKNNQRADRVIIALGAASAIVAVEPNNFYHGRAQKAVDTLNNHFGVAPKKTK